MRMSFTAYLEQVLCPQLREGDTLILDNLSTHKISNVTRLLSAHGVGVATCLPTAPTSIRSNWRLPNLKPTCANRRPGPDGVDPSGRRKQIRPVDSHFSAQH